MRAFEAGFEIGARPIDASVVEAVLLRQFDDLEPRLIRNGYDARSLVEQFDAKPAEIREPGPKEHPMASRPLPSPAARRPRRAPVEMTALLVLRPLSESELKRVSRVLAAEGLGEMRPTRITLAPDDAKAVAAGDVRAVPASLVRNTAGPPASGGDPGDLTEALAAARGRGAAMKEALLADPDMLNTAAMAELLGMSEEGVRLKRKRHEILGIESAKRGIRYPAWQVLEGQQLLPALPRLFAMLGDDPWRLFRFLQQHHGELGGARALDSLRQGRIEGVLAAAENTATGAFA